MSPCGNRSAIFATAVIVALLAACSGGAPSEPAASSSERAAAERGPLSLKARVKGFAVHLTWGGAEAGPGETFEVVRNGEYLSLSARSAYVDLDPPLDRPSSYLVRLKQVGGSALVESEPVKVRIVEPPVSEARLDGSYLVRATVTAASSGWEDLSEGDKMRMSITAKPRCKRGPCDASITSRATRPTLRIDLDRVEDDTYVGRASTPGWACLPNRVASLGEFTLHVDEAHVWAGEWIAKRGTGSLDVSFPASTGCVGSFSADLEWAS